ncbi:hypothetical protein FOZ60_002344 [Perkinsus olseni]|uniref:SAP domain-containing protein n=1 Tax=Perkinsus olseni TaxID=32597 RepID=A0A7J6PIV7_PEROL|nr:hypothetical protein FOZ60_002344 [Perkinsus olseni]
MAYSQSGYSNFQSRIEGYGNTAYDGQDDSFQGRASAAGSRLASEVGATVSAIQDGSMYSSIREQAGEAASILSQAASGVAEWFRPSTSSNGYSTPGNAYVDNNVPSYTTPAAPPTYSGFGNNASGPGYNAQPPRRPWGNAAPTTAPTRYSSPPPPAPPVQPVPEASSTARGVSGALPKGKYEAQLVKQVTAPGGTRVKPSDAVLREFYRKVRNLDLEVVGNELAKALDEPSASRGSIDCDGGGGSQVLYVVDGLWAQGLEEPVTAVKEQCANTGLAELAADTHTRVKAVPILKEWGMDVDDLASAPVGSRTEVEAAAAGDLLDLAEPTKTGVESIRSAAADIRACSSAAAVKAPSYRWTFLSAALTSTAPSARQTPAAPNLGKASAFSFVNRAPSSQARIESAVELVPHRLRCRGITFYTLVPSIAQHLPFSQGESTQGGGRGDAGIPSIDLSLRVVSTLQRAVPELGKMAAGMFKAPGSPSPEDLTKASYDQQLAVKETEKAGQIGPGSRKLEDAVGCGVKYPCKGEAYKVKEFPQQQAPPMLLNLLRLKGDFVSVRCRIPSVMVAVAQETPNYQRYSVMRVGALRALCKEKGLPSDGRKEDLVNRLCNNCSSSSYSGLINASTSSIIGGPSAGPTTSKPPTDISTSDGVLSEGGIATPHESTGEGDGSSSRLTTTELHELASIADEIRHIRKQTEFSLLRVAGLITDYPPSCLATDSRYGGVPEVYTLWVPSLSSHFKSDRGAAPSSATRPILAIRTATGPGNSLTHLRPVMVSTLTASRWKEP